MTALVPVLGSTLGKIFQPLFQAMAWLIAFFYALVPNYAIAIALLTVVVMLVTAPLTVKMTRSQIAMSKLAPELKKLQQKYKGDRQKLNEEMMNLYKEHGVNPAAGCLPVVIQFPFFIILYDVIRGLTNTVKSGHAIASLAPSHVLCHHAVCPDPRYISVHTSLYSNLVKAGGKMPAFGLDLAQKVLGEHFPGLIPYALLILVAIGLQYLQMRQLNSRNPAMAQANPQAQMMQRYMPLIFAVIYINISAGVNVYFIVSSLCRMGLQEYAFRTAKAEKPGETRVSGSSSPRRRGLMERLADAQRQAIEAQQARQQALQAGSGPSPTGGPKERPQTPGGPKGQGGGPRPPANRKPSASGGGPPSSRGQGQRRPTGGGTGASGGNGTSSAGSDEGKAAGDGAPPSSQARSKDKRPRKAR